MAALKKEIEAQAAQYEERISSLEEQVTVMDMRLKEVEAEKELYFAKLSQLDQFLADRLNTQFSEEEQPLKQALEQAHQILFAAEEDGRPSVFKANRKATDQHMSD